MVRAKPAGKVARAELMGLKTPTVEQKIIIAEQKGPKISTVDRMTTKADNHQGGSGQTKDYHSEAGSRPPLQEALQTVGGSHRPTNSGSLDLNALRPPDSGPWALKVLKPRGMRALKPRGMSALKPRGMRVQKPRGMRALRPVG